MSYRMSQGEQNIYGSVERHRHRANYSNNVKYQDNEAGHRRYER